MPWMGASTRWFEPVCQVVEGVGSRVGRRAGASWMKRSATGSAAWKFSLGGFAAGVKVFGAGPCWPPGSACGPVGAHFEEFGGTFSTAIRVSHAEARRARSRGGSREVAKREERGCGSGFQPRFGLSRGGAESAESGGSRGGAKREERGCGSGFQPRSGAILIPDPLLVTPVSFLLWRTFRYSPQTHAPQRSLDHDRSHFRHTPGG